MATVKRIVKTVNDAVEDFEKAVPRIQREMFREVELVIKSLDVDSKGNITPTVANLKKIKRIKRKLNKAILDKDYLAAVNKYGKSFGTTSKNLENYFRDTFDDFVRPSNISEVKNLAVFEVRESLTQSGIEANITNRVVSILRENTQASASFSNTAERIRNLMTDTKTGKGALRRYTNTIITDSINTFARSYNEIVAQDLDIEWFQYVGALVKDSRAWCEHMVAKRWIHRSEIKGPPPIMHHFPQTQVPLNKKTGLPEGMKANTTTENVLVLAGGWNCNHQFIPTPKEAVPRPIRERFE